MTKKMFDIFKKSSCKDCLYYNHETDRCQSKKVCNNGYGEVTVFDWLFCEPYIEDKENENDIGRI